MRGSNQRGMTIYETQGRMVQRPVLQSSRAGAPLLYVYIKGGNTLDTGQDGCEYESEEIESLDGNYDPNTDDSFMTGICRGTLYKNGEAQDGLVLVLNDPRSMIGAALLGENDDTDGPDRVMVIGTISLDTPSDGPRTVYLVA